ncbi:MAG: alpha/beta hydrolase [Chloroflexi bacterium]|nr:alpha/beta hydrolase [Chloroflexota bacterium]
MRRSVKLIFAGGAVLLLATLIILGYAWYSMGKPLYEPGMVRAGGRLRGPLAPPAQSGDAAYWTVEPDIQLFHFAEGRGRNVLVIHGGPGYPFTRPWPALASLTDRYRFHYYDQRGCGQSTRPIDRFASSNYYANMLALDRPLGLGAQVADIERIRRILGDERLVVIGHSWGGLLASLYAAEFPERVDALVLVAPANVLVMPAADGGLFAAIERRLPPAMQAEYAAFLKRYLDFQQIFSKSESDLISLNDELSRYYTAATNAPIPAHGSAGGWMVQAMYLSMGQSHDYRAAMQSVSAPVLIIHGANDMQTELASRTYADALSNVTFRIIPQAGHFSFDEQPEAFATLIGEFLAGQQR